MPPEAQFGAERRKTSTIMAASAQGAGPRIRPQASLAYPPGTKKQSRSEANCHLDERVSSPASPAPGFRFAFEIAKARSALQAASERNSPRRNEKGS